MELKETINSYQNQLDKLTKLWRSLWPRKQAKKDKTTRRRNGFTKLLER